LFAGSNGPFEADPEKTMFARLFRRLLFWYVTLLAVLIVLLTFSLGTMVPWLEVVSIERDLSANMTRLAQGWQAEQNVACPLTLPGQGYLLACYDGRGQLLKALGVVGEAEKHFLNNTLVLNALKGGTSARDALDESGTEQVEFDFVFLNTARPGMVRQAFVVRDPTSQRIVGVIQLGTTIRETLKRRNELINIYLTCMVLAILLGATTGGWYFARKALLPARLAFQRQRDFIANVSHELGTPLALLRANADVLLLNRARMVPEDVELVEDIVAETGYMDRIIDAMLLLARMDADQLQLEREEFDLAQLAAGVVQRAQTLAERGQITLTFQQEEVVCAYGDRTLLEQVTFILLDNAIKYTRPGGVVHVYTFAENERACLRVSDTGIGIAEADLARLGERFYRVDRARSRETGGNGLGLSIAYGVLARHGGELKLTSQPGKGTVATILLPLHV
jgi:signal transduction histidine kinase